jgi:hypothetical protein
MVCLATSLLIVSRCSPSFSEIRAEAERTSRALQDDHPRTLGRTQEVVTHTLHSLSHIHVPQLRWIERTSSDRISSLPLSNLVKTTANASGIPSGATAINLKFGDYISGNISAWLGDRGRPYSSSFRAPSAEADPFQPFHSSKGLKIYSQQIGGSPLSYTFTPDNVAISDGSLQLTVSAGAVDDVKSAQVGTIGE